MAITRRFGFRVIVYDRFSGGDYSIRGGKNPPANSFKATNMIVNAKGFLQPRPGLHEQTPASMPVGKLLSLAPTQFVGKDGLFIVGNQVYTFDLFTPATPPTLLGTFTTGAPAEALFLTEDAEDIWYTALPSDKTYKLNIPAGTVTAVPNSPGGFSVAIFNGQLVVQGGRQGSGTPNRLYFSAVGDPTTWSFVDIGDNFGLGGVQPRGLALTVIKSEGFYLVSGILDSSDFTAFTVRKQAVGQGILHPWQMTTDQKGLHWFQPKFRQNPAHFTGSVVNQVAAFNELAATRDDNAGAPPIKNGVTSTIGQLTDQTVMYAQGGGFNEFQLLHNGIWTKHATSVPISGMVRGGNTGFFLLTDGGATAVAARIFSVDFLDDRPGFTSDTINSPGDASLTPVNASFNLPEEWEESGWESTVKMIKVEFTKFNTGTSASNHFDITPVVLGRFPAGQGNISLPTQSWDEASSVPTPGNDGDIDRAVFSFTHEPGPGLQLFFSNVRGIEIRAIRVELEENYNLPADTLGTLS